MGLANYYGYFIYKFASKAEQINKTLRKTNIPFEFPDRAIATFKNIKQSLIKALCLRHPDFSKEFSLHTDAYATGLRAILSQRNYLSEEVIISYTSQAIIRNKKNYRATNLKLLAIV